MTRAIILLSVTALTSVYGAPTLCTEDNTISVMEACYTTFIKSYGIDQPFPLAEYFSGFHAKRTDMLTKDGIAAKPDMEDYGSTLTKCLASVENCILDETYEKGNMKAQAGDGHRYNTDRLITAYQTSDRGYQIQMRHFYCLRDCADKEDAAAQKCDDDLAAIPTPECKDYSKNMQCYRTVFSGCCGPEGGEFQCNSVGAEYKIFMKDDLSTGACSMPIDALTEILNEQLTHELATEAWAEQLKETNFEDDQVREELEPIIHDTTNFATIFDDVGKIADKIAVADGHVWKKLKESKVEVGRVNTLFWVFIDKALAKNSNIRDVGNGFAASCCWLKLAGLKGADIYGFFNRYLYKVVLSVLRLIYRLKMYGSRTITTVKKKPTKGKKGAKMKEDENPLTFNDNELDDMLEKSCDSLFLLLKTIPLSACPEQAMETVDLVRDLIRLDISRDTETKPLLSHKDLHSRDRISDKAFGLVHLLCESRHSNGGTIVYTRLIMPRLIFLSWEGEQIAGSQSIPVAMTMARDVAISFLKDRLDISNDEDELDNISKLVSNMIPRCPEKADYRLKTAQSALDLLKHLPKKSALAQLQIVYNFGMNTRSGLRAITVEMIPALLKTMDLVQDKEDEDEKNKSRREKKKGDEEDDEEEEDEDENRERKKKDKTKENKGSDEDEDDEMNGTKRKIKKERKKKQRNSEDEEEDDEMDRTRRRKKKDDDDEEEEEDGNTTKRKGKKEKRKKRNEEDEEEEEDEGNTTKRRGRAAKDQSMIRMKEQKKRNEDGSEEEEESEGEKEREKEKKRKKKEAELAKLKKAQRLAPVDLRPSFLKLIVRGCLDKVGNLRARSLQQLSLMVVDGMADDLRQAAKDMVRDNPLVIVQAMTHVDEEKEEMDDEDDDKKARATKLAELAAAELKIKNELIYIVKTRMEDDVAAVRKAAISVTQTLFFEWNMDNDEVEEIANAIKLRCLDTSQMVRKQAMDSLSFLLEESLEKGHRDLLASTWLKAVLPLINDREDGVQSMAGRLVEERLINPILRPSTPEPCWNMLKRVEEEVSNRRLLVRTLAYLSSKEVKTMRDTMVDTLNKKLMSDPDHSNVIWMLLADLSTVFGDKIDPRTAVRTWYDLAENDSTNKMSYVAKVVGEGAKKLKDDELDKVSQDIQEKLLGYRVHGPHIATVYLALARLMDAVGELASGKDILERFGRKLLEEASRIIYHELDMFTEMEEDKQEVAKEDEIRVIRIVITIGEVIQLSPSLIDYSNKLFEGLKLIMSSELYLSEEFQNRKLMNSAVPSVANSRVPSVMGHHPEHISTQSSGQIMLSETVNQGSQPTVIPSQVQHKMKNLSLRKALFTASVRRCALTTIGKFCLMDDKTARNCVATFVRQLQFNPDHIIRNNIVVVLCDLCIRYTLLVDRYTPIIASCLKDRAILVRQQTLECLTILIKEAFIRWEGQLMYRFVATILDECRQIREYAIFCLKDVLLPQQPCMFFNHFIECLLYFNDVPRKYKMADSAEENLGRYARFSLSGKENEASRIKLYEFMLDTFDDRQKFITMAKMCEEIFTAVYSEEMMIEDERVVALLTDAFKVISCEQMQLKLDVGKKGDDDEDEPAPKEVQDAAKNMITTVFRSAIISSIMPHVLELRRYLVEKRHPIMKYMLGVLRALTRSHMNQLQEFFAGDKIALREIEYDIRRLNKLEEKLKLKAAERARMPPSRRDTMIGGRKEGEGEGERERVEDAVEREIPIHPNQVPIMDGLEGEEIIHPQERAETSNAKENGESVEVDMEMFESASIRVEMDANGPTEDEEMEKDDDNEKEKEKNEGAEDNQEASKENEVRNEMEEMEVEEREEEGEEEVEEGEREGDEQEDGGENGMENGDGDVREKDNEVMEDVEEVDEVDQEIEGEGNNGEKDGETKKKSAAEMGEAEVKEEVIEEDIDKENDMEERRRKKKEEKEKRKRNMLTEAEIKDEPLEEGNENQFAVPSMIGGKKRSRAVSEMSWMNESAMIGGYGQSTPRKGTPNDDEDGIEPSDSVPRLDLDISAIAPPPVQLMKGKNRISRMPRDATIEE
ncbi:hcp-6 [Pristionchus pacificus]|uniref:Hcp-6 n=1 Tax=Pristionchus pacificus TaxID=54126 RepID=A0A2A6BEB2_PRIPA|nr:hcp-6 [Pristionchus pacificus]|eukprot:PDM64214.1 hcp-6 [Pristionchus pacificus]